MAIFHLSVKVISRGKGQSAIAAAAYRSGQRLTDQAMGEVKHYRARAERILFAGIFAPSAAPVWAQDRNRLWNEAARMERRKDSTLAREIELSLPHELTDWQRLWLLQDFVREAFTRRGIAADVAIHGPEAGGDPRNVHAHILIAERQLGPAGFAARKDRSLADKATLYGWRQQWGRLVNRHLARHGHTARIDHRSLAAQGIGREATRPLGHVVAGMERRGVVTEAGNRLRAIRGRNALRAELRQVGGEVGRPAARTLPTGGHRSAVEKPGFRAAASGHTARPEPASGPPDGAAGVMTMARAAPTAAREMLERGPAIVTVAPVRPVDENQPASGGADISGYGAAVGEIVARYAARIDFFRRTLPPAQARAAIARAMEDQRAELAGLRSRQQRGRNYRGVPLEHRAPSNLNNL